MKKKNILLPIILLCISFIGCGRGQLDLHPDAGDYACLKPNRSVQIFDLITETSHEYCLVATSCSHHIPFEECVHDMVEDVCKDRNCKEMVDVSPDLGECFNIIKHQTCNEISIGRLPMGCECSEDALCPLTIDGLSCENNRSDQP